MQCWRIANTENKEIAGCFGGIVRGGKRGVVNFYFRFASLAYATQCEGYT